MDAVSRASRCFRRPRWRATYLVILAVCLLHLIILSNILERNLHRRKKWFQSNVFHNLFASNLVSNIPGARQPSLWRLESLETQSKNKRQTTNELADQIFQDGIRFAKKALDSSSIGHDNFLADFSTDQIVINYPPFNLSSPHFLEEEDRDFFWEERLNMEFATERETKHLRGVVKLIKNGIYSSKIDCGWNSNLSHFSNQHLPATYQSDDLLTSLSVVCPILVPESDAFQHFIDGTIPKLLQVLPFLLQNNVKLVLYNYGRNKMIGDILKKLLLNHDDIVLVDMNTRLVEVKYELNTCVAPPLHPILVQTLHSLTGAPWHLKVTMKSAFIILLNRFTAHNPGRRMLNYHDVSDYLSHRYGDQYRTFTERNLTANINLFGRARLIVGVHGGAFYNLNFSPKETAIVEIMPTWENKLPNLAHSIVWRMADAIGQEYWRLNNAAVDYDCNLNVNITKLKMTLDIIDNRQLSPYHHQN